MSEEEAKRAWLARQDERQPWRVKRSRLESLATEPVDAASAGEDVDVNHAAENCPSRLSEQAAKRLWLARHQSPAWRRAAAYDSPAAHAVGHSIDGEAGWESSESDLSLSSDQLLDEFRDALRKERESLARAAPPLHVSLAWRGSSVQATVDASGTTDALYAAAASTHGIHDESITLSLRGMRLPRGVALADTALAHDDCAEVEEPPSRPPCHRRATARVTAS